MHPRLPSAIIILMLILQAQITGEDLSCQLSAPDPSTADTSVSSCVRASGWPWWGWIPGGFVAAVVGAFGLYVWRDHRKVALK